MGLIANYKLDPNKHRSARWQPLPTQAPVDAVNLVYGLNIVTSAGVIVQEDVPHSMTTMGRQQVSVH